MKKKTLSFLIWTCAFLFFNSEAFCSDMQYFDVLKLLLVRFSLFIAPMDHLFWFITIFYSKGLQRTNLFLKQKAGNVHSSHINLTPSFLKLTSLFIESHLQVLTKISGRLKVWNFRRWKCSYEWKKSIAGQVEAPTELVFNPNRKVWRHGGLLWIFYFTMAQTANFSFIQSPRAVAQCMVKKFLTGERWYCQTIYLVYESHSGIKLFFKTHTHGWDDIFLKAHVLEFYHRKESYNKVSFGHTSALPLWQNCFFRRFRSQECTLPSIINEEGS